MTVLELPAASVLASSFAQGVLLSLAGAGLRALVAAAAVGAALSLLRVRNVLAQKAAWSFVLAGAIFMPLLAPWAARQGWIPARIPAWLPFQLPDASHAAARAQAWLAEIQPARRTDSATGLTTSSTTTLPTTAPAASFAVTPRQPPLRADQRLATPATARVKTAPLAAPMAFAPMPQEASATSTLTGPVGPQLPTPVTPPRPVSVLVSAAETLFAFYFVVAAVLLARLFYGLDAALRLWHQAQPVSLAGVRLPVRVSVRVHAEISSPVTIGSGILLPADYASWDDEKLRIVLAHEQSHLRQHDFYLQLAAGIYAAIFWFSPLGWWIQRRLSDLSEAISDRAAVAEAASRAAYAELLLEFAAQSHSNWSSTTQRTTQFGVAMARTARISQRIERLLNETRFRQAFAGGRARLAVAVLLAPLAVFAATASFHAEAKAQAANGAQQTAPGQAPATTGQAPAQAPASAQTQATGVSRPDGAPIDTAPEPAQQPLPAPAPAAPAPVPAPAPAPPAAGLSSGLSFSLGSGTSSADGLSDSLQPLSATTHGLSAVTGSATGYGTGSSYGHGYSYAYQDANNSYAFITGQGQHIRFSGDRNNSLGSSLEAAKKIAHGDFLWFTRDGKSYIVEDPAVIARIHEIFAPSELLGKQQRDLGAQQRDEARKQRAEIDRQLAEIRADKPDLDKQMEEFRANQPEFQKQMADLEAQMSKLQMPRVRAIDQKQLDDIKQQISQLQATQPDFDKKLSELIASMVNLEMPKVDPLDEKKMAELNKQVAELSRKFATNEAKIIGDQTDYKIDADLYRGLGERMKVMGDQQRELGEKMRSLSEEADRKLKSIIDESLKNGKAKPVE
jgi:beta-lactamase regulating signal transducer with metallopeptidase domain